MNVNSIEIAPIGKVEVVEEQGIYRLHVYEPFRPALMGLGSWTHAIILWWADQVDNMDDRRSIMIVDLPYAPDGILG